MDYRRIGDIINDSPLTIEPGRLSPLGRFIDADSSRRFYSALSHGFRPRPRGGTLPLVSRVVLRLVISCFVVNCRGPEFHTVDFEEWLLRPVVYSGAVYDDFRANFDITNGFFLVPRVSKNGQHFGDRSRRKIATRFKRVSR